MVEKVLMEQAGERWGSACYIRIYLYVFIVTLVHFIFPVTIFILWTPFFHSFLLLKMLLSQQWHHFSSSHFPIHLSSLISLPHSTQLIPLLKFTASLASKPILFLLLFLYYWQLHVRLFLTFLLPCPLITHYSRVPFLIPFSGVNSPSQYKTDGSQTVVSRLTVFSELHSCISNSLFDSSSSIINDVLYLKWNIFLHSKPSLSSCICHFVLWHYTPINHPDHNLQSPSSLLSTTHFQCLINHQTVLNLS